MASMSRTPFAPAELRKGPFDIAAAERCGVSRQQLRGASWVRLGSGFYAHTAVAELRITRLVAVGRRLPRDAVFSGRTAAWLHGVGATPSSPIEVTLPAHSRISRISGVSVRRSDVSTGEHVSRRGLPVTSRVRTFADIGRREPFVEAVVLLDMAARRHLISRAQLRDWAGAHMGLKGLARLRRAADHIEPAAESPMETRLRLVLVGAGLPRPQAQVSLHDGDGSFAGRADLYYPDQRLVIEYDGGTHRDSMVADDWRQNRLVDSGFRILRFTAGDVLGDPEAVVRLAQKALDCGPDDLRPRGVLGVAGM